jgi:spermidine synthase
MAETFLEYYEGKTGLTIGIREKLFDKQTPYQRVEVFDTDAWGHLLTIDGMVMLSERDEFVYH